MNTKKLSMLSLADLILIIIVMLTALWGFYSLSKSKSSRYAYIYYNSSLIGKYSLDEEQKIRINENCVAEISHGKIRMLESDCLDKRCIKQGWNDVMPIICLPNQIVIETKSNNDKRKMHILH
jgi:hypothetical protein